MKDDPTAALGAEERAIESESPNRYQPAAHYDRIQSAWRLIMGEEFHYGYFESDATPLGQATAALTEQMLARATITGGDRVLDVGCGTGRNACDIAETFGAKVLGITTSASGVSAASAPAAERGIDRARFEQRDGMENGLDDDTFDVVWVLESSHLMRDRTALLREWYRGLLEPGGRLVLCDIVRKREIPFSEVRGRREDFVTLRSAFGDAHMEPLECYASTLQELGLHVRDQSDISEPTVPTLPAWRASVEEHQVALTDLLGVQGVEDYVQATHILESFWRDETLGYGILAAVMER